MRPNKKGEDKQDTNIQFKYITSTKSIFYWNMGWGHEEHSVNVKNPFIKMFGLQQKLCKIKKSILLNEQGYIHVQVKKIYMRKQDNKKYI